MVASSASRGGSRPVTMNGSVSAVKLTSGCGRLVLFVALLVFLQTCCGKSKSSFGAVLWRRARPRLPAACGGHGGRIWEEGEENLKQGCGLQTTGQRGPGLREASRERTKC